MDESIMDGQNKNCFKVVGRIFLAKKNILISSKHDFNYTYWSSKTLILNYFKINKYVLILTTSLSYKNNYCNIFCHNMYKYDSR